MGFKEDLKTYTEKKAKLEEVLKKPSKDNGIFDQVGGSPTVEQFYEVMGLARGCGRGIRENYEYEGYPWGCAVKLKQEERKVTKVEAGGGNGIYGVVVNIDSQVCTVAPITQPLDGEWRLKKDNANSINIGDPMKFNDDGWLEKETNEAKSMFNLRATSKAKQKSNDIWFIGVSSYGLKALK